MPLALCCKAHLSAAQLHWEGLSAASRVAVSRRFLASAPLLVLADKSRQSNGCGLLLDVRRSQVLTTVRSLSEARLGERKGVLELSSSWATLSAWRRGTCC